MTSRTVVRKRTKALPKQAQDFSFSEEEVRSISASLNEPSWMLERRLDAWRVAESMPMPTMKDEPWRRTDIRGLPSVNVQMGTAEDLLVDPELVQPLAGNAEEALIILKPGLEPEIRSHENLEKAGVSFFTWQQAAQSNPEFFQEYLGEVVADDEGKFAALTSALMRDGIVVHVPEGVEVDIPLHSIFWAPGSGSVVFSRVLLIVEDRASVTYIHESASPSKSEGSMIHAGIVELFVGKGARLKFIEIQNWGRHVWTFTHERAHVERDGDLDWVFGAIGSHLTKNFSDLTLAGEGAQGRMSGFFFTDGDQHLDHDTQQNHLSPNTTSDLLFKGALLDQSRSVWQGMIYVAPGAQKTDGYQANRNLLLSENARADSIPGLEILADDVRCTHGATIGQLEVEPVYYLMSRGLPREQAERLVVDGFFSPIMERVPFEGVRARFERMIDQKMSQ
jgi:Fe-S cluster assembly protein SufD